MTNFPIDPPGGIAGASLRFDPRTVDISGVQADLAAAGITASNDVGDRRQAGRDWWPLSAAWANAGMLPSQPQLVVTPQTPEEVALVLQSASQHRVPVVAVAGRSGVLGGTISVAGGIAIDLTGLNRIVGVDLYNNVVDVQAGVFGDVLEAALRTEHHRTLGHHPQSIALSTVGGWLACRSSGQMSNRYGGIEDMVLDVEVALPDGTLRRTGVGGASPRGALGPDLTSLFVGSEGSFGVITSALLRVHPEPTVERKSAWQVPDMATGVELARRLAQYSADPAVLRLYDLTEAQRSFGVDHPLVIAYDESPIDDLDAHDRFLRREAAALSAVELAPALVDQWLHHRNDVSALATYAALGAVLDTVEISAPWSALDHIYTTVCAQVAELDGTAAISAHLSHSYTSGACLYFTMGALPVGEPADPMAWREAWYRDAWDIIMSTTSEAGGSLSHHHGVGMVRGSYLRDIQPHRLELIGRLKATVDPNGVLNPGKLGIPTEFDAADWSLS